MAEGRSNAGIAQALVVSEGAVEKHISSIFGRLGLAPTDTEHRRVLAVLTWLRRPDPCWSVSRSDYQRPNWRSPASPRPGTM